MELDSHGKPPTFLPGDRVHDLPSKMEATVEEQIMQRDGGEKFWGNVKLIFDDGVKGVRNSWQLRRIDDGAQS